jgi:ribosomal protein L11 methyltransferase
MGTDTARYYHEISLSLPSDEVDPVSNYIIENICGGLLLEDEDDNSHTTIRFYMAEEVDPDEKLGGLKKYLKAIDPSLAETEIRRRRIRDLDWIEAYRESVVPVMVGDSIVITPPWNREAFPGRVEIVIEPKMAFGTGRHESTRGSLAELERIDLSKKTILDLGCGSGVLSIFAAKRGAVEVIGYDIDPLAVENSGENFRINEVNAICISRQGSLEDVDDHPRFDVIVVNIIKSVIVPIIGDLKRRLAPGGKLILAGLLEQDKSEVEAALDKYDLNNFVTRCDSEWVTYTVTMK